MHSIRMSLRMIVRANLPLPRLFFAGGEFSSVFTLLEDTRSKESGSKGVVRESSVHGDLDIISPIHSSR